MLAKIFILLVLALILVSLFSALAALFRQGTAQNKRMVQVLTVRISLSIGLFVLLLAGAYFGLITGHGVN